MLQLLGKDTSSAFKIVSLAFACLIILAFLLIVTVTITIYLKMKRMGQRGLPRIQNKYLIIFEGFIFSPRRPGKPFLVVIIIKNILSISLLVSLYYHPVVQVWTQAFISSAYFIILALAKPYAKKEEQNINAILEILQTIIYFLISGFTWSIPYPAAQGLGWTIISFAIFIILVSQISTVKTVWRKLINFRRRKKLKESYKPARFKAPAKITPDNPHILLEVPASPRKKILRVSRPRVISIWMTL